jgi:hypothetical protein
MDPKSVRTYGAIAISALVCVIFAACLILAVYTKDGAMQQLLIGIAGGQFAGVVGYWIGSSASSAQKDDQIEKQNPPPANP